MIPMPKSVTNVTYRSEGLKSRIGVDSCFTKPFEKCQSTRYYQFNEIDVIDYYQNETLNQASTQMCAKCIL